MSKRLSPKARLRNIRTAKKKDKRRLEFKQNLRDIRNGTKQV
tara:strand:- start:3815 stop:3940 length:126 start_codon:yes stop_codon:yes gene_type:complete